MDTNIDLYKKKKKKTSNYISLLGLWLIYIEYFSQMSWTLRKFWCLVLSVIDAQDHDKYFLRGPPVPELFIASNLLCLNSLTWAIHLIVNWLTLLNQFLFFHDLISSLIVVIEHIVANKIKSITNFLLTLMSSYLWI